MRHPMRFVVLALLAAILAVPASAVPGNGRLQIIQLDVGQGDGAVIISPLGDVALIDDGPGGTNAMARHLERIDQLWTAISSAAGDSSAAP